VHSLYFYEDYTYLCLYFDLSRYVHLNIFTHNPQYYSYFRSDIEPHVRFVLAGVLLALEELHALQLVYRGINNENIVITESGYPLLTNLSSLHPDGQPVSFVLNSPFLSPEELNNQPVTRAADFWALGVLAFHMITGNYPNLATFQEGQFNPFGISAQLTSLVNQLLQFNPMQRLGMRSLNDIKSHAFFYGFDWYRYANQEMPSPFAADRSNCPKRVSPEEQYDYHEKENFDYSYGGGAMMAGLLFVELGSLLMISSLFEREFLYDEHALPVEEAELNPLPSNEFQEGVTFELSDGSNGSPE
jgi:serine/threonine protein kinase